MPKAYVHLPAHVEERRTAFINGLARLGFIIHQGQPDKPLPPGDVAITWNLTGRSRQSAEMARQGGGALLVTENGYYGRDAGGQKAYALALDGHNGSGRWYAPDASRLQVLAPPFKPFRWRDDGGVLIADQRGLGSPLMRSPYDFAERMVREITTTNVEFVKVREHPGRHAPARSLVEDLADARALVVWSSNCATIALIEGIPTFFCAPTIVTEGAARSYRTGCIRRACLSGFTEIGRHAAFARLAWAQWFLAEIETGEPFRILLDVHAGKLPACQTGFGL